MNEKHIELITCDSGDWEVLRLHGDKVFERSGHSIHSNDWILLLKKLGFTVKEKCISDEDMEEGNY